MATDVAELTDSELRDQLLQYGVNVGPVVSTTRLLYEKKLAKLIDSGGNIPQEPETEESEDEEEEEDEEVQFNYRQQEQHVPKPTMKPQHTSTPITQQNYTPITQARMATPTNATRRNVPAASGAANTRQTTTSKPKVSSSRDDKSGGGLSMWIKLIFVLLVAFLVYLVVINMNPSAENKIPLTYEDNV